MDPIRRPRVRYLLDSVSPALRLPLQQMAGEHPAVPPGYWQHDAQNGGKLIVRGYLVAACVVAVAACDAATAPANQMTPADTTTTGPMMTGVVYSGMFHPVVHNGAGTAEVYRLDSGSLELRFGNDFATSDGPKLEVWLVKAEDAPDSDTVLGTDYVSLGPLKSPAGAQTYEIPEGTNLQAYRSVVVWCVAFEVNFTAAPLMME